MIWARQHFSCSIFARKLAKSHNELLTCKRKVIDDDMKGLEKSITDNLAAVTVKSAAMQSISFLSSIPTNPSYK